MRAIGSQEHAGRRAACEPRDKGSSPKSPTNSQNLGCIRGYKTTPIMWVTLWTPLQLFLGSPRGAPTHGAGLKSVALRFPSPLSPPLPPPFTLTPCSHPQHAWEGGGGGGGGVAVRVKWGKVCLRPLLNPHPLLLTKAHPVAHPNLILPYVRSMPAHAPCALIARTQGLQPTLVLGTTPIREALG